MHQFRYKYCDRDTQRCQKCVAGTQITNFKETLTKPTSVYSTVESTGVSAKRLRKQALNHPALPHPAQSLVIHRDLTEGLLGTIFLFFSFFLMGRGFAISKSLKSLISPQFPMFQVEDYSPER